MTVLALSTFIYIFCRDRVAGIAEVDELAALADKKEASYWRSVAMLMRGWFFALAGEGAPAVDAISSGITAFRLTGATIYGPWNLSCLALAHAHLGQFDDAFVGHSVDQRPLPSEAEVASTSFANPAVTIARALSNTYAGIAPAGVLAFIVAQLVGAVAATVLTRWLFQK
jgi:hypothetical protein